MRVLLDRSAGTSAAAQQTETETTEPARRPLQPTRAELAECTCPDPCERDHERD